MTKQKILILLAIALLVTACGPEATPTMNPADVQGTAVAAAWTMVAQTQAAIPTATPLPPTEMPSPTPLPTFTQSAVLPTVPAVLPTATQAAAADPNNCLVPLSIGEAGPTVPVRIENDSGGVISSISINLYEKNAFGQCGAVSVTNIGKNGKQILNLPKGNWWAYAWITYQNGSSGTSSGSFVLRVGDDDLLRLIVMPEVIVLKP
jgi:hypothetical protein